MLVLIRSASLEGKLLSPLENANKGGDPEFTRLTGLLEESGWTSGPGTEVPHDFCKSV